MDSLYAVPGLDGQILSPVIHPSTGCLELTFHYYLYGTSQTMQLRVHLLKGKRPFESQSWAPTNSLAQLKSRKVLAPDTDWHDERCVKISQAHVLRNTSSWPFGFGSVIFHGFLPISSGHIDMSATQSDHGGETNLDLNLRSVLKQEESLGPLSSLSGETRVQPGDLLKSNTSTLITSR